MNIRKQVYSLLVAIALIFCHLFTAPAVMAETQEAYKPEVKSEYYQEQQTNQTNQQSNKQKDQDYGQTNQQSNKQNKQDYQKPNQAQNSQPDSYSPKS